MGAPAALSPDWSLCQLSFGSSQGRFHSHSYYDIPVFDPAGARILAYRTSFAGRPPRADDAVEVGLVDAGMPGSWTPLGESRAWSWQQGPMAQWIGDGRRAVWNDRAEGGFVARLLDLESGERRTLPLPVYAVDPEGRFALGVNMARLDALRPGYGYAEGEGARVDEPHPADDGVWRIDLESGACRLILSLDEALRFAYPLAKPLGRLKHALARYVYWFNHVKISPDGRRFTVKLRWRRPGGGWSDRQGVSLTCDVDGGALNQLADATSHVIWRDPEHLYFWRRNELALYADASPRGRRLGRLAAGTVEANVHIRQLPPGPSPAPPAYIVDTPYRETVELFVHHPGGEQKETLARFENHRPARGQFRCDLHPCPSPDGRRVVVTSLHDGGRQLYLLENMAS